MTSFRIQTPEVKQVWLADHSAEGGKLVHLYNWYKQLNLEGTKYGYFVNGSKSWLIVKSEELTKEAKKVFVGEVNVTTEGHIASYLGVVFGSKDYKYQYCGDKVLKWKTEIEKRSKIAKNQRHASYIAFTKSYKSKFTYFMRTIKSFL